LLLEAVAAGREVSLSRNAPDFVTPGSALGLPLMDPFVSRAPLWLGARPGGWIRMTATTPAAAFVIAQEVKQVAELPPEEVSRGVVIELGKRVVLLLHHVDRDVGGATSSLGMVGSSAGIRRVRGAIERVVDLPVPVLIRGETGTGKELVARAIHDGSPRRDGPFVSVNVGALPRDLAAAELFGSVKGAYTGAARDRRGMFDIARGGTLFLDEIGEASPEVQVMLLRVLETQEMYPLGAEKPVATQVRVIAATDANLEAQIHDGKFKAPLLHRLAGYEIRLPPLRERREDIGALLYQFAREELAMVEETHRLSPSDAHARPWLPASIVAQLVRYDWPGNIRQLRNLVRQIAIENRGEAQVRFYPRLDGGPLVAAEPAPGGSPETQAPAAPHSGRRRRPAEVTEAELIAVLQRCAWNLKVAADQLGIPRPSIYDLIDRCPNIRTAGDLDARDIMRCFERLRGDLDAMVSELQVSKWGLSRRLKELGLILD
jgi:two-component system nitrogen regulation response regulator GlnG